MGRGAPPTMAVAAALVLVGGFLVKFVLIAAGQASLNGMANGGVG